MSRCAVAIVLPCFNAAPTLHETLYSISQQSFSDYELIAIDDGSTDDTCSILQHAAQHDSRIQVVQRPHEGIVATLNAGLAHCHAPFIARMDADDVMHPTRLQTQVDFLQTHPDIGLVACLVEHGGDAQAQAGYKHYIDWVNTIITPEQHAVNRFIESPLAHPSVMFRKSVVENFGTYRAGDFPEDYELWLRWLEQGVRFQKINTLGLRWNDLPQRLSRIDARCHPLASHAMKTPYLLRFLNQVVSDRKVWICGAGKISRKHSALLREEISIAGFIDIDPKKIGQVKEGLPVLSIEALGSAAENFVINYVGNRGAREWIENRLLEKGFVTGEDFVLAC